MKQIDNDSLNDLFDLEIEPPENDENMTSSFDNENDETYVDKQLKQLMTTSNEILKTAQSMIMAAPDAETIGSASSMISSIGHLVSEFNKSVLMDKNFKKKVDLMNMKHKKDLEKERIKIEARKELTGMRQAQQLGSGGTFIQNQNNIVSFSQEDIIKQMASLENQERELLAEAEIINDEEDIDEKEK